MVAGLEIRGRLAVRARCLHHRGKRRFRSVIPPPSPVFRGGASPIKIGYDDGGHRSPRLRLRGPGVDPCEDGRSAHRSRCRRAAPLRCGRRGSGRRSRSGACRDSIEGQESHARDPLVLCSPGGATGDSPRMRAAIEPPSRGRGPHGRGPGRESSARDVTQGCRPGLPTVAPPGLQRRDMSLLTLNNPPSTAIRGDPDPLPRPVLEEMDFKILNYLISFCFAAMYSIR